MFESGQRVIEKSAHLRPTGDQYGTIIDIIEREKGKPALVVLHDDPSIWQTSCSYADDYTLWYDQPQPIPEPDTLDAP